MGHSTRVLSIFCFPGRAGQLSQGEAAAGLSVKTSTLTVTSPECPRCSSLARNSAAGISASEKPPGQRCPISFPPFFFCILLRSSPKQLRGGVGGGGGTGAGRSLNRGEKGPRPQAEKLGLQRMGAGPTCAPQVVPAQSTLEERPSGDQKAPGCG